jgi:hypothetical protein
MNRTLIVGALSLSFFAQALSAASAQQPKQSELRLQQLLKKMQQAISGPIEPSATVARNGKIQVTVTFTKKAIFTLPARCTATLSNFNSNSYTFSTAGRSQPLAFSGSSATCTVVIDYDWPDADNLSGVDVVLTLGNIGPNPQPNDVLILREWQKLIPLPAANGATVTVAFGNLDI